MRFEICNSTELHGSTNLNLLNTYMQISHNKNYDKTIHSIHTVELWTSFVLILDYPRML